MDAQALRLLASTGVLPHSRSDAPMDPAGREAFERCWGDAAPELLGLALALGVKRHRADDLLQEVYLLAHEKRPAGVSAGELRRWLFRVAANRCRLEHRQQRRWHAAWERLCQWWSDGSVDAAQSHAAVAELSSRVEAALEKLKPMEREVIVLKYYANFDATEIGELLALPAATVRSHLARARRRLVHDLADWSDLR
jgi:RNA polymerase sigma-70 factor, ECF subfamily